MKGTSRNRGASLGRPSHVRQVGPDRHSASVRNRNIMRIGTWNVRTLYQKGKLDNVVQEMNRMRINILGISETRWTGSGEFTVEKHKMIYSGGIRHERGVGVLLDPFTANCVLGFWAVSDRVLLVKLQGKPFNMAIIVVYAPTAESTEEDIDIFYEQLETAKSQCKSNEIVIAMGDMNAKVGRGRYGRTVGSYGIGDRNERGTRWIEWCEAKGMVIVNTWFKEHPRRIYTWKSPGDRARNQIDYITINERFKRGVKQAKTYPGADCRSDHIPVVATLQCKLKKMTKAKSIQKVDFEQLQNRDVRLRYTVKVQNRFDSLTDQGEEVTWESMRDILVETAEETLPKKEKKSKQRWMTEEILAKMSKRQKIKDRDGSQYRELDREIHDHCTKAKEEWLNKQCAEIERSFNANDPRVFKKVNELSGKKLRSSKSGCIKARDGSVLVEKEEILNRWTEYIGELFDDVRKEPPHCAGSIEGPRILLSEVRSAISMMKRNKAAGPDGVVMEMVEALENYGVMKLTEVINKIYDDGKFPDDLCKSIFITLPKKPGAVECGQHRIISLMSHITKIILRVLLQRARNHLTPEISNVQFGFVRDAGTRNAVFVLRSIAERAVEMQKDVFLCFIDYTKAFDKVRHDQLFEDLTKIGLDTKDIKLLQNLYWEQTACVRVETELSDYINIKRGVRQGCVMSPDLFNYYSELILRNLEQERGLKVGGHNITNIRYADDTILIAESEKDLQRLLDVVVRESDKRGLSLNYKKTECMVISKKGGIPCSLKINNNQIEQATSINYLGTTITDDARGEQEIKRRIALAKSTFSKLENILKNKKMKMKTRLRVLNCYVYPVLMYGCEAWTLTSDLRKRLESCEVWFLRRMLRISWTERISNDEVFAMAGTRRKLLNNIRGRQLSFLGHVIRKNGLENLALTGRIEGRRSRGRRRILWMSSLRSGISECGIDLGENELLHRIWDRELWHSMVANVSGYGT